MAAKFAAIATLDSSKNDWAIVARVVRLWSVNAGDKTKITTSTEMILADVEGVKIHAIVRKLFVKKFERVLKEGSVYSFREFSVAINGGEYRLTKHGYKINIQGNTKVALMPDSMVPFPPYVFTRFDEILSGLHDTSYLIDVIGILTGVGNERNVERGGGATKMNVIELENDGEKLTCALWGAYADEVKKLPLTSDSGPTIVSLFGIKIKEFQGRATLQNSMHSTTIVVNPDCAEANELKGRSMAGGMPSSQVVARLNNSGMGTLADDFLGDTPRKTISEVKDSNIYLKDGCCIVLATIESLAGEDDWWYLACKCHRAVYPDSVAYYCNTCDRRVSTVTARYRIKITVVDRTATASFVIFDRAASNLFQKECTEMINEFEKEALDLPCPIEISELVGHQYLFKIEVKDQQSGIFEQSYRVKRLTKDATIVKQFKDMVEGPNIDRGSASVIGSGSGGYSDHSFLKPQKLVPHIPCDTLDGYCTTAADGNLEKAAPYLLEAAMKSNASNKAVNDSDKDKSNATASKRNYVEVVGVGKGDCSPKLLKAIKIEKP